VEKSRNQIIDKIKGKENNNFDLSMTFQKAETNLNNQNSEIKDNKN